MRVLGQNSYDPGDGQVASSCENGKEPSGSTNARNFSAGQGTLNTTWFHGFR